MSFISPSIWTGFIYSVCSWGWGHFAFWKKARPAATSKHSGGDGSQSVSSPHQKNGAASGQELRAWKTPPWKLPWQSKHGNPTMPSLEMFLITLVVSHLLLEEKWYIWWERKGEKGRGQRGREKRQPVFGFHIGCDTFLWTFSFETSRRAFPWEFKWRNAPDANLTVSQCFRISSISNAQQHTDVS